MTAWIVVGSPENFERTASLGFEVQGLKSRHRKKAERMKKGDPLVWYLTGAQVFAGYAEIAGGYFEDHEPIWGSDKKKDEDYPWRVPIRKAVALPKESRVPAEEVARKLDHVAKWPAEHWRLAFQGNVHEISDKDFQTIRKALTKADGK